jgi:hypothetical protein
MPSVRGHPNVQGIFGLTDTLLSHASFTSFRNLENVGLPKFIFYNVHKEFCENRSINSKVETVRQRARYGQNDNLRSLIILHFRRK